MIKMSEVSVSSKGQGFGEHLGSAFNFAYEYGRKKYHEYAERYKEHARKEAEHKANIKKWYEEKLRTEKMEQHRLRNDRDRERAERQAKWDAKPIREKAKDVGKLALTGIRLTGAVIERGGHEAGKVLKYIDTNVPGQTRSLKTLKQQARKSHMGVKHRKYVAVSRPKHSAISYRRVKPKRSKRTIRYVY